MPFMVGPSPIRRTMRYLGKGTIVFRDFVKIFSINYNTKDEAHQGARDFVFWHLPQVQFKNPNVQCLLFKNMTPSPYIRLFLEGGKDVLIDIDSRSKEEILNHLANFTAICKEKRELREEEKLMENSEPEAYFGVGCKKHCICEIIGQVPCPAIVSLPYIWRGMPEKDPKYRIPPYYSEPGLEDEETEN